MRLIRHPEVALLYKETEVKLHVDNRYRMDIMKQIQKISDLGCDYTIEIRKKKADGSISTYIWTLIHKIAEKKNREPVSIYRELLAKKAEKYTIYTNSKSYASFKLEWEGRGEGYQVIKPVVGKDTIKCICVKGLSGMSDREKKALAEELTKECKRLGIYIEEQNERVHSTV